MKRIFKVLTLASLFAVASCSEAKREQNEDSNEVAEESNDDKFEDNDMEKDADFVAEAVASEYAEIKMAQLAIERSTNADVKAMATMLEADHTKTLNELKALAQTKAITIPVEEKDGAKNDIQKLRDEDIKDFDKKWINEMKDEHKDCIDKFEKRADKAEDADIKAFAAKTLPHLQMHLDKIKTYEDKVQDQNKDNG